MNGRSPCRAWAVEFCSKFDQGDCHFCQFPNVLTGTIVSLFHRNELRLSMNNLLLMTDRQRSVLAGRSSSSIERAFTPYGYAPLGAGPLTAFAGQRHDPLTGCYHLGNGHRLYSPRQMRYLSPDRLSPFGRGGLNAYAYCAADPVNHIDPSGRFLAVLTSIEASRATTLAAYAGLNVAAWMTRAPNNASVWGLRQLAVETALVTTGVGMLFTGSPSLQPVALGLVTAGNTTSIFKSLITIGQRLGNGLGEAWRSIGDNIRSVFSIKREQKQILPPTPSPVSSIPAISNTVRELRIDMDSGHMSIQMHEIVSEVRSGEVSPPQNLQMTWL